MLVLVGLGAMGFAYSQGVDANRMGSRVERLRFSAGIGMSGGVFYTLLSFPIGEHTYQPLLEPQPGIDPWWLTAGVMTFGFGAAALVFSLFMDHEQRRTTPPPR